MSRRFFLILVAFIFIFLCLAPISFMIFKSLFLGGNFTFKAYFDLFTKSNFLLFKNSLFLSFFVSISTIIFGVPLGVVFGKTDFPLKKFFLTVFTLPILFPPYIFSISWFYFIKRDGILSKFLPDFFLNGLNSLFFGFWGSAFVLFSIFLPVPILLTFVFIRTINPHLENAARLILKPAGVLRSITLPLIKPAIFLSFFLVFILSFGEVSVPLFLRYNVFPLECFTQFSAFYNFKMATASALPLSLFTLFFIFLIERNLSKDEFYNFKPPGNESELWIVKLTKGKKILFFLVIFSLFLFLIFLPISSLFIEAGGFKNYFIAFSKTSMSIFRSVIFAILGATLLTFFGFFIAYLIKVKAFRWWKLLDYLTIFSFALPGTVIGIGFILFLNNRYTDFIYGSFLIIILGYFVKYMALTSRISLSNLVQIPDSMENAAQVSGLKWYKRIFYIVIPLSKKGLLASWLVSYIFCLRDSDITMVVYPPGRETLSVKIFTLMANGKPQVISALCIIMIFITLILPFFLRIIPNILKKEGK